MTASRAARAVTVAAGLAAAAAAVAIGDGAVRAAGQAAPSFTVAATRLSQNPLITTATSPTLGDNINGPSVIRVPPWVRQPLGRYYMYFAHHMGAFIRLAYADRIEGPWKIHEPGVVPVSATAFYRPQPDPPENLENFYTHVASPEVYVDHDTRRLILWFHGWFTEGQRWPVGEAAARDWARQRGYGQYTQAAESVDGLTFTVRPAVTRVSYLRVFRHQADIFGMGRAGLLLRAPSMFAAFEPGPNPFRGGPYADRVRHVAVLARRNTLATFFTAIGDAPERIMLSTIDMAAPFDEWRASGAVEVLRPQAAYECAGLPVTPSAGGDVKGPVNQLRDPALFEENGRTFLFYSFCGEQGIAAAEISFTETR